MSKVEEGRLSMSSQSAESSRAGSLCLNSIDEDGPGGKGHLLELPLTSLNIDAGHSTPF